MNQVLEDAGPDCKQLEDLRVTASKSRDAVYAGDFTALGQAMIENTPGARAAAPGFDQPGRGPDDPFA